MTGASQKRALQNYRLRLAAQGLARFEVQGREADRDLIRAIAKRLALEGQEGAKIRAAVQQVLSSGTETGSVLAALRRWPLDEIDLTREHQDGRRVEL